MDRNGWKGSVGREQSVEGIGLLANESKDILEAHPSAIAMTDTPGQSKTEIKDAPPADVFSIDGWPPNPNKGDKDAVWLRVLAFITNIAMALFPLLFIILSIAAIILSGSRSSSQGDIVKIATGFGPSIFPILFAGIVGRALKACASYQAGRGAKLGVLEQILGSLTVFSTIETQILLRSFNLLGIGLLMVWALSPLGGQASLRLLELKTKSVRSTQNLTYMNMHSTSWFTQGISGFSQASFAVNTLYSAALLTPLPVQTTSMDTWGNLKIPTLESLNVDTNDSNGWLAVDRRNPKYSSLLGVPVDGLVNRGQSHFTLESYYFVLGCANLYHVVDKTEVNWGSVTGSLYQGMQPDNTSAFKKNSGVIFGFFLDSRSSPSGPSSLYPYEAPFPDIQPQYIVFGSLADGGTGVSLANCSLTRSSVESNVTCNGTSCAATEVRRSAFDLRPPGYTPLNDPIARGNFMNQWPISAGSNPHPLSSTPTELFVQDPSLVSAVLSASNITYANLYELFGRDFQRARFSSL